MLESLRSGEFLENFPQNENVILEKTQKLLYNGRSVPLGEGFQNRRLL